MGLRRSQGSRSKQRDSDKRRHALNRPSRVRERGMRLPSGLGGDTFSPFTFHLSCPVRNSVRACSNADDVLPPNIRANS